MTHVGVPAELRARVCVYAMFFISAILRYVRTQYQYVGAAIAFALDTANAARLDKNPHFRILSSGKWSKRGYIPPPFSQTGG